MSMKAPPHLGELVRDSIDELGLSVAKAAIGLGVTRQQLHNVVSGRSGIAPEMALRLERAFGGTAELWLRMQMNHDLARLRGQGSVSGVTDFTRGGSGSRVFGLALSPLAIVVKRGREGERRWAPSSQS